MSEDPPKMMELVLSPIEVKMLRFIVADWKLRCHPYTKDADNYEALKVFVELLIDSLNHYIWMEL
jgi:hypothetical protein